jgi:serine phosphatase RsbU (regulator of sigma subunit)
MPELRIQSDSGFSGTRALGAEPLTLGRASANDLAYPEDTALSRQHLRIESDAGRWWALDLGSKNGTLVNGQRLSSRHPLAHGDTLEAGTVRATFVDRAPELGRTVVFTPTSAGMTSVHLNLAEARSVHAASRLQVLVDAARELAGHSPIEALYGRILDLALHAVGAERGLLLTSDQTILATRGEGFRISSAVRDRVMEGRESVLVVDVHNDAALRESQTIVAGAVRSLMAVPLQTETAVLGLLYVDSSSFMRVFSQEDLVLATLLANIAAIRIDHARLIERAQQERILQAELAQAADIQAGLLPAAAPVLPGYDLAAASVPCRSVGGDFYDYVTLAGGRTGVLLGDVSGKGMAAALLLAGLQARVHVLAEQCAGAGELIARLNRGVAAEWPGNRFMTLFALALDPATGEFDYCNAGHNPPLLVRAGGKLERLEAGGPVLGILANAPFGSAKVKLEHGDTLLLYSDGVSEAERTPGDDFGEQRLILTLREACALPAEQTVRAVFDAVRAFLAGTPAGDDTTALVLRRV